MWMLKKKLVLSVMYLSPTNIQIRISGVLCIARLKSLDSIFNVAVHA